MNYYQMLYMVTGKQVSMIWSSSPILPAMSIDTIGVIGVKCIYNTLFRSAV